MKTITFILLLMLSTGVYSQTINIDEYHTADVPTKPASKSEPDAAVQRQQEIERSYQALKKQHRKEERRSNAHHLVMLLVGIGLYALILTATKAQN